jgi:O-antigen ligase
VLAFTATLLAVVSPGGIASPRALESVVLWLEQAPTAGGRFTAWALAVGLTRERPVAGSGFGTTEEVFGPQAAAISLEFLGRLVHNPYLQTLLELGPVGLVVLLLAVANALRRGWLGPRVYPLWTAVYGALVAGVTSFESSMLSAGSIFAFNFWLVAAASVRLGTIAGADSRQAFPSLSGG